MCNGSWFTTRCGPWTFFSHVGPIRSSVSVQRLERKFHIRFGIVSFVNLKVLKKWMVLIYLHFKVIFDFLLLELKQLTRDICDMLKGCII